MDERPNYDRHCHCHSSLCAYATDKALGFPSVICRFVFIVCLAWQCHGTVSRPYVLTSLLTSSRFQRSRTTSHGRRDDEADAFVYFTGHGNCHLSPSDYPRLALCCCFTASGREASRLSDPPFNFSKSHVLLLRIRYITVCSFTQNGSIIIIRT